LQPQRLRLTVTRFNNSSTKEIYTVEAHHPDTGELLGYILFEEGTLEFTNFKSHLGVEALDIGETTKQGNENAAGGHGEGFKNASLVMTRNGYRVQYQASNCYWNMLLKEKKLYCEFNPIAESTITKRKKDYAAELAHRSGRKLINNSWEDVSVKIGKVNRVGEKIKKSDFLSWLDICYDLNPPSKSVSTSQGYLILDNGFREKQYLKGLLLEDSSTSRVFQYGYNFFNGQVHRD
jgi:hypothetical protein